MIARAPFIYRNLRRARFAPLVLLALALTTATSHADIPADRLLKSLDPTADVNDFVGILMPEEKQALEARCKQLREKTGAQLAVVILKSLEGGQIDDFTVKLFKQWGIGQKGKDNGILLLVAIEDRKARIEVGYGLEPILPDVLAGRILREQLFPAFKQQKYAEGLSATVSRIAEIVERNEPPRPEELAAPGPDLTQKIMMTAFMALFVAIGSFVGGAGAGSRVGALVFFGLIFAGGPLLMGCVIAWPWAPAIHLPIGLVLAWLGWLTGRGNPTTFRQTGRRSNSDAWVWGNTSSSSGWSGGGFSGGGSSWGGFGGGSSGGGGASGSW